MIDTYLTDTVDIILKAYDEWGNASESVQSGISARVEDTNRIVKDRDGKEVVSTYQIIIDKSATVTHNSTITIKTKSGEAYSLPNKEWIINKLTKAAGWEPSHWEVWA